MKAYWFLILLSGAICMVGQAGWAAEAYVTDSFEITFRTGPGVDRKIIATLRSGDPVEVLEPGETWSRVRVLREGLTETEGWVLSPYLMTRRPWEVQAKALLKENGQLKMRLESVQNELREVSGSKETLRRQSAETGEMLEKLKRDYQSLREESADFLKLKEEHEKATASLQELSKQLSAVTKEKERLESMQQLKWFGMGALILLFGLLIGVLAGRAQRKRKLSYY